MVSACEAVLSPPPPAVTCVGAFGLGAAVGQGGLTALCPPPSAPAWGHWVRCSRQSSSVPWLLFLQGERCYELRVVIWGSGCMGWRDARTVGPHWEHGDGENMRIIRMLGPKEHRQHEDAENVGTRDHRGVENMRRKGTLGAWGHQEDGDHRDTQPTGCAMPESSSFDLLSHCPLSSAYFCLPAQDLGGGRKAEGSFRPTKALQSPSCAGQPRSCCSPCCASTQMRENEPPGVSCNQMAAGSSAWWHGEKGALYSWRN